MSKRNSVVIIRRSCVSGKAVWIYVGPTKGAAWQAYRRACLHELERVRNWCKAVSRRKENIMRMLNECMPDMPITATLPSEQEEAARQLVSLSKAGSTCYRDFYNHIMEDRRRRTADRLIRQRMKTYG